MNTEADFIRAILADPDDDTTRLAFADWLDENGQQKRATFIRRQIANAQNPQGRTFTKFFGPLRPQGRGNRETLLQMASVEPWEWVREDHVTPMILLVPSWHGYYRCIGWHRGFPAIIGCTERSWHAGGHKLFSGPIEGLCFAPSAASVWGVVLENGEPKSYVSRVNGITVEGIPHGSPFERTKRAFSNVRRVFGACWAGLLHSYCQDRFKSAGLEPPAALGGN